MAAFPKFPRSSSKARSRRIPWPSATTTRTSWWPARPMKDHLRFSVAYWHTMRGTGGDPFGPGTMLRPWEGGRRLGGQRHPSRPRGLRVHGEARRPVLLLPRPRHRPRGQHAGRDQPEPRRRGEGHQGGDAADRHQAALGHRQPVQQSALHARRGHQPQRRRLRLRRRPGEEGPGSDQGTGRRAATCSGAAAKATRPSGTPT